MFRPGALPDMHIADGLTDDDRLYAPLSDTVGTRPLFISTTQNRWCDVLMARGAGLVNRHYHPHQVFAYTISGKWGYLEHDWVASEGMYVFEPPGEIHTLVVDQEDEMITLFHVCGTLIYFDDDNKPCGFDDVHSKIEMCQRHFRQCGLGEQALEQFIR